MLANGTDAGNMFNMFFVKEQTSRQLFRMCSMKHVDTMIVELSCYNQKASKFLRVDCQTRSVVHNNKTVTFYVFYITTRRRVDISNVIVRSFRSRTQPEFLQKIFKSFLGFWIMKFSVTVETRLYFSFSTFFNFYIRHPFCFN